MADWFKVTLIGPWCEDRGGGFWSALHDHYPEVPRMEEHETTDEEGRPIIEWLNVLDEEGRPIIDAPGVTDIKDVTSQPAASVTPSPNAYALEAVMRDETLDLIEADARYQVLAVEPARDPYALVQPPEDFDPVLEGFDDAP